LFNSLLAHRKIIAPFSPSQLYAVVLAPAMCGATPAAVGPTTDIHASSIDWLTVLTNAALKALVPPRKKSRLPTPASPQGKTAQPDLLQ